MYFDSIHNVFLFWPKIYGSMYLIKFQYVAYGKSLVRGVSINYFCVLF